MKLYLKSALFIVGVIALAGCGQSTSQGPTAGAKPLASIPNSGQEDFPLLEQKSVAQMLAEPGWRGVSKGAWLRTVGNVDEWMYLGSTGAAYQASQIRAELSKMSRQSLSSGQEGHKKILIKQLEGLDKSLKNDNSSNKLNLTAQTTLNDCTASGSLLKTTAQPGVKAYGTGNCSNPRYNISGYAYTYTSTMTGAYDTRVVPTTVNYSSYAYGTSGCFSQVQVEFGDPYNSSDRRVAINKSSYSCQL